MSARAVATVRRRTARKPWSRRRAWTVLLAGVLVTVLGVGAALLTWSMHEHDARQRARFVPVTATRVDVNGASFVTFETRAGRQIQVREPQQHGDPNGLGPTVKIRYDPADPEHVIVDSSTAGRDITFAIVASSSKAARCSRCGGPEADATVRGRGSTVGRRGRDSLVTGAR